MSIDSLPYAPGDTERPAYVASLIELRRPIEGARVLDLACRSGAFSVALGHLGATVVGLEGRTSNLAMAPAHPNVTYVQGDVRRLSEAHGLFDVVLCLGILYHLDAEDAVALLKAMRQCTQEDGFVIIDTHAGHPTETVTVDGNQYQGHWFHEPVGTGFHDPAGSGSQWSSIGNSRSWWFTPGSLRTACHLAGWGTVEVLPGVRYVGEPAGRLWMVLS